jgi:predicted nucleotidyltransferase
MKRDEVLAIVAAHRQQLQAMGVKSLELFGSVARDEAGPDSDVDFLVEFDRPVGLFDFSKVRLYLEDVLGVFGRYGNTRCFEGTFKKTCSEGCDSCPLETGGFLFRIF